MRTFAFAFVLIMSFFFNTPLQAAKHSGIENNTTKELKTVTAIYQNDTITLTSVIRCGLWIFGSDYDSAIGTTRCFRSSDNGATWLPVVIDSVFGTSQRFITANGTCVFAVSPLGLFRSTDYGAHWYIVNNDIRLYSIASESFRTTTCNCKGKKVVLAWEDGTVSTSFDLGKTWTPRKRASVQAGLRTTQFPADKSVVYQTR